MDATRPTTETVRHLAALHGLSFDEARLSELATLKAAIQDGLAALEDELDGVEPAVGFCPRQGAMDGRERVE